MSYSGVEALVVPWLTSVLGVRCVTETPSDLAAQVPVHRVVSAGGAVDAGVPSFVNPRVSVDSFAVGYGPAAAAAEAAKRAMLVSLPRQTLAGCTVTRVELQSGPVWIPYADTSLRQFSATYLLWIKTS